MNRRGFFTSLTAIVAWMLGVQCRRCIGAAFLRIYDIQNGQIVPCGCWAKFRYSDGSKEQIRLHFTPTNKQFDIAHRTPWRAKAVLGIG